jgi:hypothetical protein
MAPLPRALGFVLAGAVSSFAPPATEACPPGTTDAARAARVTALLASTPDGARLAVGTARPGPICFVAGDGGLTPGRAAWLDRDAAPEANAARLGHLWQHVVDAAPTPSPSPGEPCAAWRAHTKDAEARGDAVEARIARALGGERIADHGGRERAYDAQCGD